MLYHCAPFLRLLKIVPGVRKVKDWLILQQQMSSSASFDDSSTVELGETLEFVKTLNLEHIQYIYHFTVSKSGSIAIASQPSLSVVYPDQNRRPVILSADKSYGCPVFLEESGREQLAATCSNDSTIHLWDIEGRTSRTVYALKSGRRKLMNLCVIDGSTLGYGEVDAPGDGSCRVYILNTGSNEWSLRSTIQLNTGM